MANNRDDRGGIGPGETALTGKRFHYVVFGFFVIIWMEFNVQLVADGELVFQVLNRPNAAEAALDHNGQTGTQGFALFETI